MAADEVRPGLGCILLSCSGRLISFYCWRSSSSWCSQSVLEMTNSSIMNSSKSNNSNSNNVATDDSFDDDDVMIT